MPRKIFDSLYAFFHFFYRYLTFYFLGLVIVGFLGFATIPFILRFYGIATYGVFSTFQNLILILITLNTGWLSQIILRFDDHSNKFRCDIFNLYVYLMIPSCFVGLLLSLFLKANFLQSILVFLTVGIGGFLALRNSFFQSNLLPKKYMSNDLLRALLFPSLCFLFEYFEFFSNNITSLIVSLFLSYLLPVFLFQKRIIRYISVFIRLPLEINLPSFRTLKMNNQTFIEYGVPLGFWLAFSGLLNVVDRYIIAKYLSQDELGVYSSIYDITYKPVALAGTAFLLAGVPLISRFYNNGEFLKARKILVYILLLEMFFFGLIIFAYQIFKETILDNVLGIKSRPEYVKLIFPILYGSILWQFAMLLQKYMEYKLNTKLLLFFLLIVLVLNIVLNINYVPKFGLIFASNMTLISSIIYITLILCGILHGKITRSSKVIYYC